MIRMWDEVSELIGLKHSWVAGTKGPPREQHIWLLSNRDNQSLVKSQSLEMQLLRWSVLVSAGQLERNTFWRFLDTLAWRFKLDANKLHKEVGPALVRQKYTSGQSSTTLLLSLANATNNSSAQDFTNINHFQDVLGLAPVWTWSHEME